MKTRTVPLITYHKMGLEHIAMLHAMQTGVLEEEVLSSARWNWDVGSLDKAADLALTVAMEVEVEEE